VVEVIASGFSYGEQALWTINPAQSFLEKEIILVDFHRNTAELERLPLPADGRPETSLVVARISVKPVLEYTGAREAVKLRIP